MFEYLGYHRIVSIKYYTKSLTKSLGAQELSEWLCARCNERFPVVPKLSHFPMPRAPREWLNCSGIDHAIVTIESVEEPQADEDAIPKQQGSRDKAHVKAATKEDGDDDWVMVPENGDGDEVPLQQGQRGNGRGKAVSKRKWGDDWVRLSSKCKYIPTGAKTF